MATRDLTPKFRDLRSRHMKSRHHGSSIPFQPEVSDKPRPYWVKIVNDVEEKFREIDNLVEKLHEAHKARLMVHFGDDRGDAIRDKEIDTLTGDITKHFESAKNLVKLIQSDEGGEEAAICKNVQRTMATKLQTQSLNFRKLQKEYLSRMKELKSGKSAMFPISDDEDEEAQSSIKLSDTELLILGETKEDLKARDREIQKIAKSIEELASIFHELAVLVIEQGTILDRIEYNMDAVVEKVESGGKKLDDVVKIQKQARPQKCITILLIIIFVLIVILAFKHS